MAPFPKCPPLEDVPDNPKAIALSLPDTAYPSAHLAYVHQGANLGEEVGVENDSGNHPHAGQLTVTETLGCQPGPTAVKRLHS